jgi:hypothetical protein
MAAFIDLPWRLYADDPAWVPPLRLERRMHFSRFNPFFEHAEWQAWTAYRDGQPVGRISAQVDQLHREHHREQTGHFGLLESIDDTDVVAALTRTAEEWLAGHQTRRITGPFNFSINQDCGILVDGFDTPPVIMMPHSQSWYGPLLEEQGYAPAKDLLAYWIETDFETPPAMREVVRRFKDRVKLRPLRRKQFKEEMEILRSIFNDAWSRNWGFIPFTEAEFADIGTSLRLFVPDNFIQIAEVDGEPASFIVLLPNLNEAIGDIGGRLLPFGWAHLIRRTMRRDFRTGRVALMGVRKQYQSTPLGLALAFQVCDAARSAAVEYGIKGVEMSWILEDNKPMRSMLEHLKSKMYKRYRLYEKTL